MEIKLLALPGPGRKRPKHMGFLWKTTIGAWGGKVPELGFPEALLGTFEDTSAWRQTIHKPTAAHHYMQHFAHATLAAAPLTLDTSSQCL